MGKPANGRQIAEVAGILARHERGHDIAQAVIEREERVLDGQAVAAMSSDKFEDEEVASTYGYPTDYQIGHAVQEASRLRDFFPKLDVSNVERLANKLVVPAGWDGTIVVPKFSAVKPVKSWSGWNPFRSQECRDPFRDAMKRLIGIMRETRTDFVLCDAACQNELDRLRLHWRTLGALLALEARTPGDVLIFPAQTGIIHRGKTIRRSRTVFVPREFGLDPFCVGVTLLLHPDRLNRDGVLWIDCAGAEDTLDRFARAPSWQWRDGSLQFRWGDWRGDPSGRFGSASGMLPEWDA